MRFLRPAAVAIVRKILHLQMRPWKRVRIRMPACQPCARGHTCCHCWDTKLTFTLYYRNNGETKQILSCNCHTINFCHSRCCNVSVSVWAAVSISLFYLVFVSGGRVRSRRRCFLSPASGGHQNCRKRGPGSQWHCRQLNYICDSLPAGNCSAAERKLSRDPAIPEPSKQAAQYARRRWLLSGPASSPPVRSRASLLPPIPLPAHCVLSRVTDATGNAASLDSQYTQRLEKNSTNGCWRVYRLFILGTRIAFKNILHMLLLRVVFSHK